MITLSCGCEQREYHIATFDSNHLAHEAAAVLKDGGISQVIVKPDNQRASTSLYTTEPYVRYAKAMLREGGERDLPWDGLKWNDEVSRSIESSTLIPTRQEEAARFWNVWRERVLAILRERLASTHIGDLDGLSIKGTRLHIQLHETGNADVRLEFQSGDDATTLSLLTQDAVDAVTELLRESVQSSQTRFLLEDVEVQLVFKTTPPPNMLKVQTELELAKSDQPYVFSGRPAWQYKSIEVVVCPMIVAWLTLIGLYVQGRFRFLMRSKR